MAAHEQGEEGEDIARSSPTQTNNNNHSATSDADADPKELADDANPPSDILPASNDGSKESSASDPPPGEAVNEEAEEESSLPQDGDSGVKLVVIKLNPKSSEQREENGDGNHVVLEQLKATGGVDQWVKYLDETNVCHRLRSLCKKGDLQSLLELLESNNPEVDIDAVSEEGWTCMHEIITHECQFTEVARLLLRFGAKVNTQDLHGDSPLHSALLYHNSENIRLLLEHGADLAAVNLGGRMPIHVADEAETLRLLLEHQAAVDAQDRIGNTALHYAVVARDRERVCALLDASCGLNVANRSGSTPLHLTNDSDLAQLLLDAGANPNLADANANTPLHLAVRGRHKDIVRLMLEKKADAGLANSSGKTPMNLAKDKEMRSILLGNCSSSSSSSSTTSTPSVSSGATPAAAVKRAKKSSVGTLLDKLISSVAPQCTSPGILKRRRSCSGDDAGKETRDKKGPRLRFSDVNDYSGVEVVEEVRRVKVTPIYSEPQFSSDDD